MYRHVEVVIFNLWFSIEDDNLPKTINGKIKAVKSRRFGCTILLALLDTFLGSCLLGQTNSRADKGVFNCVLCHHVWYQLHVDDSMKKVLNAMTLIFKENSKSPSRPSFQPPTHLQFNPISKLQLHFWMSGKSLQKCQMFLGY